VSLLQRIFVGASPYDPIIKASPYDPIIKASPYDPIIKASPYDPNKGKPLRPHNKDNTQ